ncbi:hypothetical protein OIU77_026852 [Salix suchowensis]|uniref:Uncharacterized protein n=1 Tax=Salix suchowensis TaxID=1278906 RepID=A0ABQ9BQA8_9ROSI|nr:hypothetical protein OIU77_026852 [Salix suchowensis]
MKSILFRWNHRIINGFVCDFLFGSCQVLASQSLCCWGTLQPSLSGGIFGFCSKR